MRPGTDVLDGVVLVRTAKEVLPDGWPMFLVWEYGLEELLPYLPDPRVVLTTGLQWQRIKGTPGSLVMALAWLDIEAAIEQETATGRHWFEYQIDPGRVPAAAELVNLVGLARLSAPVGTRLSRVFHGYDRRRAIYDETGWSDGSLWSDHSGVYNPDLDVDLSFGHTFPATAALGNVGATQGLLLEFAATAKYIDRARYDFVSWGDGPPVRNYAFALTREIARRCDASSSQTQAEAGFEAETRDHYEFSWSDGGWDDRTWGEPRTVLSSGMLYLGVSAVLIDGQPIVFPAVAGVLYVDSLPVLVDGQTVTINELDSALLIDSNPVMIDADTINFD